MKHTLLKRVSGVCRQILRHWENIGIALLFLLLLVQCTLFMIQYTRIRNNKTEAAFDMQMLSSSTMGISDSMDDDFLLPLSITVRDDQQCATLLHSAPAIRDIYASLQEICFSSFTHTPTAGTEELWEQALSSENVLYFRYATEIPYQLIHACTAQSIESNTLLQYADTYVGVEEILIVANTDGNFSQLLTRGSTQVYTFPVVSESSFSVFQDYVLLYSDVFYASTLSYSHPVTDLTIHEQVQVRDILVSDGITTLLMANQSDLRTVLKLMNFNPDKLNSHTEADGTYVFVESHGVLRMDSQSMHYIASDGGGLEISSRDASDSESDVYSCLRMISQIVQRFSQMSSQYTGGDASLYLESVYTEKDCLIFTLSFRCDNIPLYSSDQSLTVTFTFSEEKLIEFHWPMISVGKTLQNRHVMLQSWCRDFLAPEGYSDVRLVYVVNTVNLNTITAVWSVTPVSDTDEEER